MNNENYILNHWTGGYEISSNSNTLKIDRSIWSDMMLKADYMQNDYVKASRNNVPEIKDVNIVVPNKVVEVSFIDGTKEKAVCMEPDIFSLETAIAICISKKIMGGSAAYNNAIRRGMKVYENKLKREKLQKEEQERIKRKKIKRQEYKKRRAEKKKEEQISIQTEAYIRAMEYMRNKD